MTKTTNLPGPSYDDVVSLWRNNCLGKTPFVGQFLIQLTSALSQIEGIDVSYNRTREIFENGSVRNYTGDIRELYSVLNNQRVAEFLNESLLTEAPVTPEFIRKCHKYLMFGSIDKHRYEDNGERAGDFKRHEYCVGRYDVGATAEETPGLVAELCETVNGASSSDVLKTATVLHCFFQNIHPFADGNGRVGRWVTNYFLVLKGHPPLLFSSDYKDSYYDCLARFDEDEEFIPLYEWMKSDVVRSAPAWRELI